MDTDKHGFPLSKFPLSLFPFPAHTPRVTGHASSGNLFGRTRRKSWRDRRAEDGAHRDAATILGPATHDVFLNEAACWQNVPEKVWDYTIGGYQVIKKWLSYREFDLLGRALTPDEAREVTHMARRIAALILLQPELDRNYQSVKAATVALE